MVLLGLDLNKVKVKITTLEQHQVVTNYLKKIGFEQSPFVVFEKPTEVIEGIQNHGSLHIMMYADTNNKTFNTHCHEGTISRKSISWTMFKQKVNSKSRIKRWKD